MTDVETREEWFQRLAGRYPLVCRAWRNTRRYPGEPLAIWGVECGVGWADVIEDLLAWLERHAELMKSAGKRRLPRISQIKEKFGRLNIGVAELPPSLAVEYSAREDEAMLRAAEICEDCGKPSQPHGGDPRSLCTDCRRIRKSHP